MLHNSCMETSASVLLLRLSATKGATAGIFLTEVRLVFPSVYAGAFQVSMKTWEWCSCEDLLCEVRFLQGWRINLHLALGTPQTLPVFLTPIWGSHWDIRETQSQKKVAYMKGENVTSKWQFHVWSVKPLFLVATKDSEEKLANT